MVEREIPVLYKKKKKNAAVVRHVMPSARKKLYLWWKTKKALNIHKLMKVNACGDYQCIKVCPIKAARVQ